MDAIEQKLVERTLAWLIRKEGVSAEQVERAVTSAVNMKLGEATTLRDGDEVLRRVFVQEQARRLRQAGER